MDKVLSSTVTIVVVNRHMGSVDWELLEVRATMSVQLSVKVGKDSALKQRVFGEINTANDVAGLELGK